MEVDGVFAFLTVCLLLMLKSSGFQLSKNKHFWNESENADTIKNLEGTGMKNLEGTGNIWAAAGEGCLNSEIPTKKGFFHRL